jgi:hypothetical protein
VQPQSLTSAHPLPTVIMPVISRLVSIPLRIGEIAFAGVVVGILAQFFSRNSSSDNWPKARFIYTMIVACLSVLLAFLWLIPFSAGFTTFAVDIFLSLCWFAVFGLMVDWNKDVCNSGAFEWGGITKGGQCNKWRAVSAFAFLSAVFWLVSALVGMWFVRRERRSRAVHEHK